MSFLGGATPLGLSSFGLTLRSNDVGEVHVGGDAGGLGLLLGVKLLNAEGPPVGECIDEAIEVLSDDVTDALGDTLGYGEYLCCFSLSASIEEATPL